MTCLGALSCRQRLNTSTLRRSSVQDLRGNDTKHRPDSSTALRSAQNDRVVLRGACCVVRSSDDTYREDVIGIAKAGAKGALCGSRTT